MTITVNWEQGKSGGYAAAEDRLIIGAILAKAGVNAPGSGVFPSGGADLVVAAQVSPNMTVSVGAGQGVIPAATGAYIGTNSASVNVTITTANASNPRIDLIVFQVGDTEAGDASTLGQIVAIPGSPNASPSPSATPARSIALAQVRVEANTTSIVSGKVTDVRTWAVAAGGLLLCKSSATYPATPYIGMPIFDLTLGYRLTWDGTIWEPENTTAAWTSWTPTFTGFTLGNGTVNAKYCRVGKALHLRIGVVFGSTSAVTSAVAASLPSGMATVADGYEQECIFKVSANAGGDNYAGWAFIASNGTTFSGLYMPNSALTPVTKLAPFGSFGLTMGANASFQIQGTLQLA